MSSFITASDSAFRVSGSLIETVATASSATENTIESDITAFCQKFSGPAEAGWGIVSESSPASIEQTMLTDIDAAV
ncbi:MAG: hypothetical protein L0I80_05340, partial [Brevibacterium sp.]|nr:hypothetical protein [Brevibacterium sp.]